MAQTAAETTKVAEGPPGPHRDYHRKFKADGGTAGPMTNQQLKESGAGFWADMAKQGAAGLPQGTVQTVFS